MQIKESEIQLYRPYQNNLVIFLQQEDILKKILFACGILACVLSLVASFITNGVNIMLFIIVIAVLYACAMMTLYLYNDPKDTKEAVIPNERNKNYLLCLGTEVKKFYGDAVKSGKALNNKIRPILINAETMKRHFLCMATIGAGKSVLMKGLIEQYTLLGGGMMIVDGKGTDEFAKEIYGLVASLGREDDFVYLNFLDMDNTHTINPLLSGGALSIYEILIALLIGEENEWKEKQKEFMKCVLKLMVYKRDNEKDFIFDFSALTNMMSLTTLVKEAINYKHLAHTNIGIMDFVKYVSSTIEVDIQEFLNGNKDDKKWVEEMYKKTSGEGQGIYDVSVCVGAWRNVLTNLSSDYGRIFNAPNPDISLWEATQRNKIIFVTLPTMDSDTTPKELGRLILGLIKGVAAQKAKFAKEPKIPFTCFLDELGSYVIEGFGRLESKSRSLGISIFPFFQSPAQIDVVAKNDYERKEIIDVTGVHILMKNMHPETTEFYAKMVEKIKVMSRDFVKRRDFAKGQGAVEDTYKVEEKDAIEHNEVVNMNNGEMIIFANGKLHRAIAQAESSLLSMGKKTTYQGMSDEKIPLTQYVSKREFFNKVSNILNELQNVG
ncbi:type IV secretory system conjugative DNA transfer family protein [Helicobacter sp. UBA3407]|uniref:type IV secretory system conjugative DNA transfer family protein n=1 Tax=Helicobacter TaxID=209 RepID=UPI00260AF3AD|nr:TraM recognition domain-containing protein [Helicobacter sp. UBA3407]